MHACKKATFEPSEESAEKMGSSRSMSTITHFLQSDWLEFGNERKLIFFDCNAQNVTCRIYDSWGFSARVMPISTPVGCRTGLSVVRKTESELDGMKNPFDFFHVRTPPVCYLWRSRIVL
jgi:hypothetical protein